MAHHRLIAEWRSRGGKYWLALWRNANGTFSYVTENGGGYLGHVTQDDALLRMSREIDSVRFRRNHNAGGAIMENRIFSTDSPKAIKADAFGFINAIHYLAPHSRGGVGNLCVDASPACIALCLGHTSGQAGMVPNAEMETGDNAVRRSRREKTQRFMRDRANYMRDVCRSIDNLIMRASEFGKRLCVRMNGSSDIAFEGIRFQITRDARGRVASVTLGGVGARNIFDHYADIDFVDYTKNPRRFDRALPRNYWLTFSRSETNEAQAIELLRRGVNVAVVFGGDTKPMAWSGFSVIDGDEHDLRHLDPRAPYGTAGFVIGLSPKGRVAKRDSSGFVVH